LNFQKWFNQCIRKDDKIQGDLAEVHGHKIFLHPKRGSKNGPNDPAITGIFDPIETNFLKNTITKGQVIVDVGAGVGEYTILFASMVGKTGKVFAFEPNLDNFNLLKKNFKMNKYNVVLDVKKSCAHVPQLNLLVFCRLFLCTD